MNKSFLYIKKYVGDRNMRDLIRRLKEYLWEAGYEIDQEDRGMRYFFYSYIFLTVLFMLIMIYILLKKSL